MHALVLRCSEAEAEFVLARLYELGTAGVTERDQPGGLRELEAFFEERPDDALLSDLLLLPGAEWQEHAGATGWVDTFAPLAVGQRLYLVPDWRDDPVPDGRFRLTVYARQASGSGYQPATQLALEALERHLEPGELFLDVGTGSGILSAAAALLGAGACVACDLDLAALGEARENGTPAHLFGGSARAIRSQSVGLVAANLNAEALLSLGGELVRVLRPGGRLILSGFTARNLERLTAAFGEMSLIETLTAERWRAVVLRRATGG